MRQFLLHNWSAHWKFHVRRMLLGDKLEISVAIGELVWYGTRLIIFPHALELLQTWYIQTTFFTKYLFLFSWMHPVQSSITQHPAAFCSLRTLHEKGFEWKWIKWWALRDECDDLLTTTCWLREGREDPMCPRLWWHSWRLVKLRGRRSSSRRQP